jgi:hypothetical protein
VKDVMGALLELVKAEASITALVGARVYVNRIPREVIEQADTFHPPKILVLRQAGGNAKADLLPTDDSLVTTLCYGESDHEADKVRRAVWTMFVNLQRAKSSGDVLVHHINPSGGAIPLVDPEIVWPAVAQSYVVKADVMEVA